MDPYAHLARLSPFELKDHLVAWAATCAASGVAPVRDAGRGNPDWLALPARDAFFLLGAFACDEARMHDPLLGGAPVADGLAGRFLAWAERRPERDAIRFMRAGLEHAERALGLAPEPLLHELVVAVLGGRYPDPPAVLPHVEAICRAHVARVCGLDPGTAGGLCLFATEGASAGVCYVLRTLLVNGVLAHGDRVAVVVPVFTPYLELPGPDALGLELVPLRAEAGRGWQLPDAEVDKLRDAGVRLLVAVNPGNPTSVALDPATVDRIGRLVETQRRDLLILSDDVYGPLAPGYASLVSRMPRNTIVVYSFSKFFGATGWRLGVIAMARDHAADALLAARPEREKARAAARYAPISEAPETLSFMSRMVAESREIAFHHTAGLSTPQQAQMALLALGDLTDAAGAYRSRVQALLQARRAALWRGLGAPVPGMAWSVPYYETLDLAALVRSRDGDAAAARFVSTHAPLEPVVSLARTRGVVVLPGSGFGAPPWTIRVSLANLSEADFEGIGRAIRDALAELSACA